MPLFRSPPIKKNLELRAAILAAIRLYFEENGYLEVETPNRIPAPAPEAHIEAEPSGSWFLHTSPELCMKRLLAAGFERIFQICKCYRKGERGRLHLPEMTMLEWYSAGHDYLDMMQQCEDLITFVARSNGHEKAMQYQGQWIDFTKPWDRMTVDQAFEKFATESLDTAIRNGHFDETIGCDIAPNLGGEKPVFLYDYPAVLGSLARLKPGDKSVAERFELYIAGIEICNAFSELTDPAEQRKRFETEMTLRRVSDKTAYPLAEPFLQALACMPESAGNALGIDRLIMLFADTVDIDAVVTFTPETS
jgi:lysyl-tRNA synthetase class 2